MNLQEFLEQASHSTFWDKQKSLCFQAESYPYFFFYQFFKELSKKKVITSSIITTGAKKLDKEILQAALQQTMLGEKTFYWLSDISQLGTGEKNDSLYSLLNNYKGPNSVAFFTDDQNKAPKNSIKILSSLTLSDFKGLLVFFDKKLPQQKLVLAESLFQQVGNKISLNTACLLINYLELMSTELVRHLPTYLSGLIDTLPALTVLAEHFFTRNGQQFFSVWQSVAEQYSDMFWFSFWSDQLWRAYHTRLFLEKKMFAEAKRMSYRLPYNFIQSYWKKITLDELSNLHQELYSIDYKIKQGSQFCHLDRWYLHYFNVKKTR